MTFLNKAGFHIPEKSQAENLLEVLKCIETLGSEFEILHSHLNVIISRERTSQALLEQIIAARFCFSKRVIENSSQDSFYEIYLDVVRVHVMNLLHE